MAKPNAEQFLDLVVRSGLVEKEQLDQFCRELEKRASAAELADPRYLGCELVDAGYLTRWQRDRLLDGRYKGFFVKRYKLLDHLGSGGMSSVYLAEHLLMRRRVAIKVLPKNRVEDAAYLDRFLREAQAVAALDHRNIVRAYDVDKEGSTHFLVMEYVEGRNLQLLVREEGPLDYVRAADYIRQAAEGLAHAHAAGLIHRDIKPANLLVDQNNVVKVLDLGLARFEGEDAEPVTAAYEENVLGTADYLAPEQALDSHRVDARADIYSLGCALYFLLTGHAPFGEVTLPQRLMMHQKHTPPSIFKDRPGAPEDLVALCMKMMAKRPEDRPQTAREVADSLAGWLMAQGHAVAEASVGVPRAASLSAAAARGGAVSRELRELARALPIGPAAPEIPPPGDIPRAVPLPDDHPEVIGDTSSALSKPTIALPASPPRATAVPAAPEARRPEWPVARRLEEQTALVEFLAQAGSTSVSSSRGRAAEDTTSAAESGILRRRQTRLALLAVLLSAGLLGAVLAAIHVLSN
jgi:tRNA A-37 threonylcarbamoyl transferase component Bud32